MSASEWSDVPPSVSVIIPVKNGASTIAAQLEALTGQTYSGEWELLVADNGSTDCTVDIARSFETKLRPIVIVDASEIPGSSHARNRGADSARGQILCFCDADDVVSSQWLESLVDIASTSKIAGGRLETESLNDPIVRGWRPKPNAERSVESITFAPSGNMMIHADVFQQLGGFDEQYLKSHDVELSRRAQAAGYEIGFCTEAVVAYRLRSGLRDVAHQAFRGGRAGAQACADGDEPQRPLPVSLRDWGWLLVRLPTIASRRRRGIWIRRAGEAGGRIAGSVRWRVRYL